MYKCVQLLDWAPCFSLAHAAHLWMKCLPTNWLLWISVPWDPAFSVLWIPPMLVQPFSPVGKPPKTAPSTSGSAFPIYHYILNLTHTVGSGVTRVSWMPFFSFHITSQYCQSLSLSPTPVQAYGSAEGVGLGNLRPGITYTWLHGCCCSSVTQHSQWG